MPSVCPDEFVDESNDEKLPLLVEAEGVDDIELSKELVADGAVAVDPIDDAAEDVFAAIFLTDSPTEETPELILLDAVFIALIWTLYKFY